jgi:anaerobic selenocysteine-containing dehydrogenase
VGGTVRLPEDDAQALGRPLSSLAQAAGVSVEDGVPLEETAPIAALWARQGRRDGADGPAVSLHVPRTPNGVGVAHAVGRAGAKSTSNTVLQGSPALLVVSGEDAAAEPAVRELAEGAGSVIALTMFQGLAVGWADLVFPGTSYLERDGSMTNMEGRVQRLRRAVIPPAPDELAWLAKLAQRFEVELSPYASAVHEELFSRPFAELGERAELDASLPDRARAGHLPGPEGARLVRYRPLFSGPAVERVPKFEFQRPNGDVDLSPDDARRLGVRTGDVVTVRTNGTSAQLRARVRRGLEAGVVLVPEGAADELQPGAVEVTRP